MALNDGRVVSSFINNALRNKNIIIYGKGYQTRSFCYIDDLIEALIKLMNKKTTFSSPINVGNNYEISIMKLAKMIIDLTGSSSKIIHKKATENDPKIRKPNINKIKKIIKWKPRTSINQGLKKTISYFEKTLYS